MSKKYCKIDHQNQQQHQQQKNVNLEFGNEFCQQNQCKNQQNEHCHNQDFKNCKR